MHARTQLDKTSRKSTQSQPKAQPHQSHVLVLGIQATLGPTALQDFFNKPSEALGHELAILKLAAAGDRGVGKVSTRLVLVALAWMDT
jgi:hypothetical protein